MLLGEVAQDPLLPQVGGVKVEIDWAKTGNWKTYGDNVTSRVRPNASAVTLEYGRDQSTALSPTVAGRGSFTLDNRNRHYSPRNTASPLYGKLKPARPVRVTRTIGSSMYRLFAGHTDDSPINPDIDAQTVSLTLLDYLADFRGQTISTGLYRDLRTGEAIGHVLDACGWPSSLRDLDLGATVIPWWWEDGTDAMEALDKIIRSEGPPALLTLGPDGEVVFRDRHHRLTRTNSLVSQSTWRSGGVIGPIMARPFMYDEAWHNIINTGTASVDIRTVGEPETIWTSDTPITLAAGESRRIIMSTDQPYTGADFSNYQVSGGTVTIGIERTAGTSSFLTLRAFASPVTITGLAVRARLLTVAYTVQVSSRDSQSVAEYGARAFQGDLPWCGIGDAQAILDVAVGLRSQPLPVVQARFMVGYEPATASQLLGRDLSDLVTVVEPETATNGGFYVESIRHELTGAQDHSVTFGLEAAPTTGVNAFRFGAAASGFDEGVFSQGIDFAAKMLRFDIGGQGFNQGCWAN